MEDLYNNSEWWQIYLIIIGYTNDKCIKVSKGIFT